MTNPEATLRDEIAAANDVWYMVSMRDGVTIPELEAARMVREAAISKANKAYRNRFNIGAPKWQTEFPGWHVDAIPDLGSDWTDSSWRNDVCPSFIHEPSGIILWCGAGPDGGDYEFCQMQADSVHGWQHGAAGNPSLLHCDTIGEVRDVLDHEAIDGCTMQEALRFARMRLNQLTADDARAFMAENDSAPRPCPDLHAHCLQIIAAEGARP